MEGTIKRIYDLLYLPLVTPFNLLENAKLDNYDYVKYYKGVDGLVCEMRCVMDNDKVTFKYFFDENDKLVEVGMKDNLKEEYVFNREQELLNQIEKHKRSKKSLTSAI